MELVDPEGLPLRWLASGGLVGDGDLEPPVYEVTPLTHAQFGPFREHYLTPAQAREQFAGRTFVPVTDALTEAQIDPARGAAGPLVLLTLVGHRTPELSPVGADASHPRRRGRPRRAPSWPYLWPPMETPRRITPSALQVVANYAGAGPGPRLADSDDHDDRNRRRPSLSAYSPRSRPSSTSTAPRSTEQGLVLFFTGLSGSGKSTLARALMDRILEQGARTVTSLDGDVVRRNLSAGPTFSKADRETNIRRIGWVAAEISRHGGVAVCSPIAPFDETRQQVRAMVDEAGGAFFLVHVATPLEECERRDRKGLYAKARRGEIPEFTGISSPYEEPDDADVRVDTTGRSIDDALGDVVAALADAGYLELPDRATIAGRACRDPRIRSAFSSCAPPTSAGRRSWRCTPRSVVNDSVAVSSAGTYGLDSEPMSSEMASRARVAQPDGRELPQPTGDRGAHRRVRPGGHRRAECTASSSLDEHPTPSEGADTGASGPRGPRVSASSPGAWRP